MQKLLLSLALLALLACGPSLMASRVSRTPLPTLTPTLVFPRWEAVQVIRVICQAGLECENIHQMAPEEYGSLPVLANQGIRFSIPSICPDCKGMVLSFDQAEALETIKRYYLNTSPQANPEVSSWVFVKDNVLLQLSAEVPKAQALQYGTALVKLK